MKDLLEASNTARIWSDSQIPTLVIVVGSTSTVSVRDLLASHTARPTPLTEFCHEAVLYFGKLIGAAHNCSLDS